MEEHLLAQALLFVIEAFVFALLAFFLWIYYQGLGRQYVKLWMLSLLALSVSSVAVSLQNYYYDLEQTHVFLVAFELVEQVFRYLHLALLLFGLYCAKTQRSLASKELLWMASLGLFLGGLATILYAFNEHAVFNRFYLRVSLQTFVFGCSLLGASFYLFFSPKQHFSSKVLMWLLFLMGARYLLFSFASIIAITEDWFRDLSTLMVYVDFGASSILGFTMLIWMQGAERNAALVAMSQIQYLGKHDSLTGVLNREQVIEKLPLAMTMALEKNNKLSIFLLDIKHFKFINDTYGLKAGDYLLGEIAKRLNNSILLPQVVGRLSGDSFVFVLDIQRAHMLDMALDHLHELISRPYRYQEHEITISCSIGYCFFPEHGENAEELLQNANMALFEAESHNKPSVEFEESMQSQGRYYLLMEKEIRNALEADEFVLYFQPQLNLLTNRLEGVEALIRWQHPDKGLLSPDKFLPDIEKLGLNSELDGYVLNKACQTIGRWYEKYHRRIVIAVNITAVEFQDPELVDKIQALLFEHNVPSSFLELEITENMVMTDINSAMGTIVTLQSMGIKVSIDDFGTGYSSLVYLRKLPIDKIKIDRSFITEVASNDSDLTIVKSMVELSHGLGKRVLAEGVETVEQLNLLRHIGCDAVQGYFIKKPLPEDEFVQYLKRR
ncbi:putative bifunctional diguanylate cyclase/phosphodiesterase [Thalassomonas haliotis]|uniref:EAL domain-containing protein n=1 Tax=Thalassomonas haliotis TaxID=485448 RepID=A0ABY7VDI4_9GAMM|nr:GGDEF domain-containing phosphodiesterase [Thalassomonas haliotis]WDE11184.1 EAL domain-containing protein [Thalassomonas haliotis]